MQRTICILITLLFFGWEIAFAAQDFKSTLDSLYSRIADFIFEDYIKNKHRSIVLLPVIPNDDYETTIQQNCNATLIKKLNSKIEASQDSLIRVVKITVAEPKAAEASRYIFLQIELNEIRVNANFFQLTVFLKERAAITGKPTIRKTFRCSGSDAKIHEDIVPRYKPSRFVKLFAWVLLAGLLGRLAFYFLRKRHPNFKFRLITEENIPFWRMTMISLIMVVIFFGFLIVVKRNAIAGHSYFEGAEVYFFIDRNSGLFFGAGENNFINITRGILKTTCNSISYKILHPETPELEKLSDWITQSINKILGWIGLGHLRIREFPDLKQSEYTYAIYAFSEEKIERLVAGNLAELVKADYDSIIAPALKIDPELRQSSLIKPLATFYDQLLESKKETKRKKKFIIIFTDADESFPENVTTFMENVNRFSSRKDQYLRVFSVLFPNIPRISSDIQIYPYEEGKLLLLSKISEFVVYMNGVARYTPERLEKVNALFYKSMEGQVQPNDSTEMNYAHKLAEFKKLTAHMPDGRLLSIDQIAGQNFLKNFVELETFNREAKNAGAPADFFLYTYVNPRLYKIENLDFAHGADWANPGNYNLARGRTFGQSLDPAVVDSVVNDVTNTFVNQFIIVDKEPDKESLIFKINQWISILAIAFSIFYAYLLYRYKHEVNYRLGKAALIFDGIMLGALLLLCVIMLGYFHFENRWTIYGNRKQALGVVVLFLAFYYGPSLWHYLRRRGGGMLSLPMIDSTFSFDEVVWLKWVDRIIFNIVTVAFLTFSLFLQILSPVYKPGVAEVKDSFFISMLDSFFMKGLDLSDYNQVIEYFLIVWIIVASLYLLRAFIYSKTARVITSPG